MPRISRIFLRLGYEVFHVPGVSRAWRHDFGDRSYLLITDLGGYDLPEPGGPYAGMYFSARDELIECIPLMSSPRTLLGWIRHTERLSRAGGIGTTLRPFHKLNSAGSLRAEG